MSGWFTSALDSKSPSGGDTTNYTCNQKGTVLMREEGCCIMKSPITKSDRLKKFCTQEILEAKKNYIFTMSKKLEESKTAPKAYWAILNCLIYNKKIPAIPLLFVKGNFVSDFSLKANLFNDFYASICTPIQNSKVLPPLKYRTSKKFNSFSVFEKDILFMEQWPSG